MKVVGIDLSISRTGVAVITERNAVSTSLSVDELSREASYDERLARLVYVDGWLQTCLVGDQPLLIVLESMLIGSNTPGTFERAGLWWMVYQSCRRICPSVALVHPKTRAKWATGNANAKKPEVVDAVNAMWPNIAMNHDEADALVLAGMGRQWLNLTLSTDKNRRIAVNSPGCKWPATPAEVLARYSNRAR